MKNERFCPEAVLKQRALSALDFPYVFQFIGDLELGRQRMCLYRRIESEALNHATPNNLHCSTCMAGEGALLEICVEERTDDAALHCTGGTAWHTSKETKM